MQSSEIMHNVDVVDRCMHSVMDVDHDNWNQEVLEADVLVIVDFWHEHCPWCKKLEPVFVDVSEEYKDRVRFARLNVLENPKNQELTINYGIMGTPTLAFFCDGRIVGTVTGFQPKDRLRELVEDMIEKHRECVDKSTEIMTS